jgi:hypothetical protein
MENAMDWLRTHDLNFEGIDDQKVRDFANLAGIPMPWAILSSNDKTQSMQDALDFLRNNNFSFEEGLDDMTLYAVAIIAGIPVPRGQISAKDKTSVL